MVTIGFVIGFLLAATIWETLTEMLAARPPDTLGGPQEIHSLWKQIDG